MIPSDILLWMVRFRLLWRIYVAAADVRSQWRIRGDIDLGGCDRVLIVVPGATPSQLALGLGKDGKTYLCNRNNLGSITAPVASANVAKSVRVQSAAAYRTSQGRYFVFRNGSSAVSAYKITRRIRPP